MSLKIYLFSCFLNYIDGYIKEIPALLWLISSLYPRTQTQGGSDSQAHQHVYTSECMSV